MLIKRLQNLMQEIVKEAECLQWEIGLCHPGRNHDGASNSEVLVEKMQISKFHRIPRKKKLIENPH